MNDINSINEALDDLIDLARRAEDLGQCNIAVKYASSVARRIKSAFSKIDQDVIRIGLFEQIKALPYPNDNPNERRLDDIATIFDKEESE